MGSSLPDHRAADHLSRAFRRRLLHSLLILIACFMLITLMGLTLRHAVQRSEARRANEVATQGAEVLARPLRDWQDRLDELVRMGFDPAAVNGDPVQDKAWLQEAQNLAVSTSGLIDITVSDRHGVLKTRRFSSAMSHGEAQKIAAVAAAVTAATATVASGSAGAEAEDPHAQARRLMTLANIRGNTSVILTERLAAPGRAAVTAVLIVPQATILAQAGLGPNHIRFIRAPGDQVMPLTWAGRASGCMLLPVKSMDGVRAARSARCSFIAEAGLPGLAGFSLILAVPEPSQSLVWLAVFLLISVVAATTPWILAKDPAAPGQELAEMRHDLRAVAFNSWLLLDHLGNTPSPELLARAREGLAAATHSLLDMTAAPPELSAGDESADQSQPVPCDGIERISPLAFLRSISELMRPLARGAQLEIALDLEQSLPDLLLDRARLSRILVNLVSNAARHAPGSLLRISATVSPPAAKGEIGFIVLVSDSGPGLPLLTRLRFALSARRHRRLARVARPLAPHEHEGRGLAIIRRLSAEAGGRLELLCSRRRGTTFRLILPAQLAEPARRPDLNGLQVLGVDDSEQVRIWLSAVMERCGARVQMVATAQEALARLGRQGFDVLLADVSLPDMSGIELARRVTSVADREMLPDMIAYTSFADAAVECGCREAGFISTLIKSHDPAALLWQLDGIAKARRTASLPGDSARECGR